MRILVQSSINYTYNVINSSGLMIKDTFCVVICIINTISIDDTYLYENKIDDA